MARHGENIHKRKDGRWEARVIIGYDDNHKAIYKSYYGNSYEDVKQKKLSVKSNQSAHTSLITFDKAAGEWLSSRKGKVKESSYNHYLNQYEFHIRPVFGNQSLKIITSEQYTQFLIDIEKDGYSYGTLCLIRTIIMMILKYAEENHGVYNKPKIQENVK